MPASSRTKPSKARTRKRPTKGEARLAKDTRRRSQAPAPSASKEPEAQPTYEPPIEDVDLSQVIVDVEEARIPRSETANAIAALAKGVEPVAEQLKSRKAGSSVVFDINPYDLWMKPGWNQRNFQTPQRKAIIAGLGRSISKIGVRETLIAHIEGDKIYVDSGWNRLFATYYAIEVLGAEVKGIPVRFGRQGENEADRMLSQIVNNDGTQLTPYEQGLVIKQLIAMAWNIPEIASKLGRSITNVKGLLDLQELPTDIRLLVDDGTVSAYFATKAYRDADEDEAKTLRTLHSAITKAREMGSDRVMPKHAENAPLRRTRSNAGGRRETPSPPVIAPPDSIPRIIEILRGAWFERDDDEGIVLMKFPVDVFDDLAVLAELPETDTGIAPPEAEDEISPGEDDDAE